MRAVKAFALGAIATGVLAYAAVAVLAVAAQEGGHAVRIAIGSLVVALGRARAATSPRRPSAPACSCSRSWEVS